MHNGFAACFVLCALLHFALESRLERLANLSSSLARTTRRMLVHTAAVGCATFISHVCIEETANMPIGIGKLRAACAEIATCACFLVYLASYWRSFEETTITLGVAYKPTPSITPPPKGCASAAAQAPSPEAPTKDLMLSILGATLGPEPGSSSAIMRRCFSAGATLG